MVRTKVHRLAALLSLGGLVGVLAGCQWVQPSPQPSSSAVTGDRLVGVFVTTQSASPIGVSSAFPTRVDATQTGSLDGGGLTFVFPGLDGMFLMAPVIDNATHEMSSSAEIGDIHLGNNRQNSDTSITLDGTIYVTSAIEGTSFMLNPIYQTTDGSIYAVPGTNSPIVPPEGSVGVSATATQSINDTVTVTSGGQTTTDSATVSLNIKLQSAQFSIAIVQMDVNNVMLQRTVYVPGQLPDTITVPADTAYLIVETVIAGPDGNPQTERQIYSPSDAGLTTLACPTDGICVSQVTQIDWP